MITVVRVAPYEQWCEPLRAIAERWRDDPDFHTMVGQLLTIETSSMRAAKVAPCGGREWRLLATPLGGDIIDQNGIRRDCRTEHVWICEHMLELE